MDHIGITEHTVEILPLLSTVLICWDDVVSEYVLPYQIATLF